uniref:Metalloendopeptidase n=1 Tax=Myripristis murdjan TaxID=586833 RepID=A0A667WPC9_9TELE
MELRAMISLLLLLLLGLSMAHPGHFVFSVKLVVDDFLFGSLSSEILEDESDITSTILRMNNGSTDFLIEGDVLIPRTRSAMRCFSKTFSCLWSKSANGKVEIPFIINSKYDTHEKNEILNAMKDFHSKTCIRFVPRVKQRMYISFEPRYGCFSSLGRLGDKQVVSLQRFGCVRHGIIQHELLHALGFYHEHTRSDRDQYVRINWEYKKDSNNLNTPYDYSSVMHYGRTAFASQFGKETITPIPDPSVPIGQRQGMSDIDIRRINTLYKCCK